MFEENTTLGEDEKWLAEVFCGRETSVCFIAKPLYYWRRRDSSATHTEKEGITKNNLDSIRVQEELLEAVKVLQDAELEELLKWRLYLAVMDVVRKCYKRRDTENFRCYYQKLKQIGTVRTFGESGTEKSGGWCGVYYSDCGFCKRSACSIVLRMARVNSNIYAEMIVKMRKLWFSFWW